MSLSRRLLGQELSLVQLGDDGTPNSPLRKLLPPETTEQLLQRTGSRPGDLLLIAAGSLHTVVRPTDPILPVAARR